MNFENLYLITSFGRLWSIPRNGTINNGKFLSASKSGKYLKYTLSKNNKLYYKTAHRLVAEAFIKGNKSLTVNHKDGNKHNNNIDNLEWATFDENFIHALKTKLIQPVGYTNNNAKKWYAIKKNGKIYRNDKETIKDFCKKNNIHNSTIIRNMKLDRAVSKRHPTLSGWRFYHD